MFVRATLTLKAEGRFLLVEVTNTGTPATFSGIVQPGRGTASAAIMRTALWHHTADANVHLATNQSASIRLAQRDRPPTDREDDRRHDHPEGSQAWRMCFLKRGAGAALERVCPVQQRSSYADLDGVVLTLMADPPLPGRTVAKTVSFEGNAAVDPDTGTIFHVDDSPRHYHAKAD